MSPVQIYRVFFLSPTAFSLIQPSIHPLVLLLHPSLLFTRDGAVLTPVEWRTAVKSGNKVHFSGFWKDIETVCGHLTVSLTVPRNF
jgi:hypothetical protein